MLSREQVLEELRAKAHHPATAKELLRILRVPRQDRATLRRHLNALVASGDLIKIRGNRFGLADRMDVVVGRLETHPRGFGFVVPDTGRDDEPNIYIASPNLKEALHGDRVVARIERHDGADRVEGRDHPHPRAGELTGRRPVRDRRRRHGLRRAVRSPPCSPTCRCLRPTPAARRRATW